ncbi:MAG: LptA/OstA family protein [Planctomycetaceae bacterium]|nr:LptA/OstA family protein [Planctomycetaceae bacterium]
MYGWVIVPFLLPSREESDVEVGGVIALVDELKPFLSLFGENDWELDTKVRPKVLKNGNTIILFGKESITDNNVKLQPCTFIILPEDESLTNEQLCQRAVVMRSSEMAEIKFAESVNFSKFPLPPITGGRLLGNVTIASDMKEAGKHDDLLIQTSDIEIVESPTETIIYAVNSPIKFKLGLHSGEGSRMTMTLKNNKQNNNEKSIREFAFLRLESLKFLNLAFPEKIDNNNQNKNQSESQTNKNSVTTSTNPITTFDVTCQREFTFETDERNGGWTAAFNGNVEVVRTNPDQTQDFLNGELMHINFQSAQNLPNNNTPKSPDKTTKPSLVNSNNLQPAKMEVFGKIGTPAKLRSVQNGGLLMEGDRILYDISQNLIAIETALTTNPQETAGASPENPKKKSGASENVKVILQNRYTIQSELGFIYHIGNKGEFGTLNSSGRGRLDGLVGNDEDLKKIHLTWNVIQISAEPNNPKRILFDLRSGVTLEIEDFGKMTAEILQLWCNIKEKQNTKIIDPQNKPNDKNTSSLVPDTAVVLNKVHFENQNGTCDVQRLNVFFNQAEEKNNFANITQATMATLQTQINPITHATTTPQHHNYQNYNSPIQTVQYVEQKKRPEQFMPYLPPIIELPRPTTNTTNTHTNTITPQNYPASDFALPNNTPMLAANIQNHNTSPTPQPQIKNVRSQNLLGFQPNNQNSIYAITGDQMEMSVLQANHNSQVQRLWIGGNVRIIEKTNLAAQDDLVEIVGEEVYVWNPSTINTVIHITGKDSREAIFTGKGTQIRAMNVYIFRAENVIKITGPGRLVADTKSKNPSNNQSLNQNTQNIILPANTQLNNNHFEQNKRNENDTRILVQWNKEMYFDGNIILFKGTLDRNGNRVLALMEDREIRCNEMQIFTNRYISLFDDKSDITVKPERICCAFDVVVKSEKFENGLRKSFDWAEFDAVEIRIETNEFFAKGPGQIRSTFLESNNALSDPKNGYNLQINPNQDINKKNNNNDSIMFLSIWFYDHVQGVFAKTHKTATIKGHIDAVLCPISTWDERIERDQLNIATKKGYLLKCEELRMVQIPDPAQQSNNCVELTAIDNATIEGENRTLYGRAQTIKYNQAKSQVMLEGNELNHARVTTASQGTIPAQRIEYNIKTGTAKIVNSRTISAER